MAASLLKRGFKADAERKATAYREEMSLHPCAPLCAFKLAAHLGVIVFASDELIRQSFVLEQLVATTNIALADCGWSALTMPLPDGKRLIIHNHAHNKFRQQSNIMHELAHIICDHQLEANTAVSIQLRKLDAQQEEEANCLGSILQLSTPCLLWARKQKMDTSQIAAHFVASIEMVEYRMRITGLGKRGISSNR